jgi:hypothetical protein
MPLMRYEHRREPLVSRRVFLWRLVGHGAVALGVALVALSIGIVGYRVTEGMPWLDAFLNAAMILGGMGPVGDLHSPAGKAFAGIYALFAGVVFLMVAGVMLAPLAHRLMHRLHMEESPGS